MKRPTNEEDHFPECLEVNKNKSWNTYDCTCDEIYLNWKEQNANEIAEGDR